MKKTALLLMAFAMNFALFVQNAHSQIAVTVTGSANTTPALASTYPSLAAAITAINSTTAMTGPVIFDLAADGVEIAPAAGFLLGSATLNPLTSAINTLSFQKSGTGANPLITAFTPGTSTSADGIWKIQGADFVSISSIDLQENAANTTATTQMEWGYAIVKLSLSDGSQNITISNCNVSLNKANAVSKGIYSGNHIATSTTALTIASAAGTNANIKINGCNVSNCYIPINIVGYTTNTFYDSGLEIGTTTANIISNFGGGATTTYGIYVNGQTGIKIENNTLTLATGTTTTAYGIYVGAACIGYVKINANTVSVSSSATTTQLTAINNLAPIATIIDITNNIIQNCSFTTATTGSFQGIYEQAAVAGCTVNITGNTISTITYSGAAIAGSGTVYGIYKSAGAATAVNVNSNIINGIAMTGTTGGTLYGIYIATGSTQTANNNSIYNNTISGTGTAGTIYCIRSVVGTIVHNLNTIYNNQISKTTGTGAVYGIYNIAAATAETYSNNTIYGLSSSGVSIVSAIYNGVGSTAGTRTVSGNLIYTLSSAGGTIHGIYQIASSPNIFKNKIYDLSSTASTGVVYGITIAGGAIVTIYNNLIGDLRTPAASAADAIRGINITSTTAATNCNVYYNTIYLNAASTGTNFGTSGIYHTASATATTAALLLRNNIIANNCTPSGTGLVVAFRRNTGTAGVLANYASTSNNNLFYAGTPGSSNLIYYDGTTSAQTLAAYTAGVFTAGAIAPRDAASITQNPTFLSTTGSNVNFLHIDPTIASPIESSAAVIASFDTDFDGDLRFGNASYTGSGTAPDMGADEFSGIPAATMLFVSSNTVQNTGYLYPGTVNQTILRIEAVTSGSSNPLTLTQFNLNSNGTTNIADINASTARVYYTSSSSTFSSSILFGSATPTIADFTVIGSQLLSEGINYFWLVYDVATSAANGNLIDGECTNMTIATIVRTPTTSAPAGNKAVLGAMSGNYNIGSTQTFPNFTSITSALADLNGRGVNAAVTLSLMDTTYSTAESFPLIINAIAGASAINTITIKPAIGVTTIIRGSSTSAILKLNGADYITIDGSNSGGTTRDLSIVNSSTGTSSSVIWMNSIAAPLDSACFNTVKNTIITGNAPATTLCGIVASGSTVNTIAAAQNTGNLFQNNLITAVQIGIDLVGDTIESSNSIIGNTIGSVTATSKIGLQGIYISNQLGVNVSGNTVLGITSNGTVLCAGIYVGGSISGGSISGNYISDVKNATTRQAYGIELISSSATTAMLVSNNMISDVTSSGTNATLTRNGHGMAVITGGGYNIYYNTVALNTTNAATTSTGIIASLYVASVVTNLDIRNNIFSNSQTSGTRYAIYSDAANTAYSTIDYNDYASSGTSLGYLTSARATLANLITGFGQNSHSINVAPVFTSITDLHMNLTSNDAINNLGSFIATVSTDFDGASRDATTPDMGADEFTPPVCAGAVGGTASVTGNSTYCGSGTPVITATGYSVGTGSTYQWQSSIDSAFTTPIDIAGQINRAALTTGTVTTTTYYRLKVTCTSGLATDYSNVITITINPIPANPANPLSNSPNCIIVTLTQNGIPPTGETWYWQTTAGGTTINAGVNDQITNTVSSTATYYIRSQNNTSSCWSTGSGSMAVVVNVLPATAITPNPANAATGICYAGGGNISSVSWAAVAGATSYDVFFGGGSLPVSVTQNVSTNTYNCGVLLANTTYNWKVVAKNGCGDALVSTTWTFTTAAAPCPLVYCTNTNTTNTAYYISSFSTTGGITDITNNATGFSTSGYGNYTAMIASAFPNSVVNFSITETGGTMGFGIWIDWNQDGDFADAGEQAYMSGSYYSTITGSFTVPITALSGNTRMRVVGNELSTTPTACIGTAYTECEDYTFNVPVPSAPTITSLDVSSGCVGSSLVITGTDLGSTSIVTIGGSTAIITAVTATTVTVTVGNGTTGIVSITTSGGIANSASTFTVIQKPNVAVSPTTTSYCETGSQVLTASGADTYIWSPATGLSATSGISVTANPIVTTTYIVTGTTTISGCMNTATATITVNPIPSAVIVTPSTATVCAAAIQSLVASGGTIGGNFTFGTAATTNTATGYPSPYTNYYGGTKHQMLIRASELAAAGIQAGSAINSISFTVAGVGTTFTGNLASFQISMKNTASTVLTATSFETGLTTVFGPSTQPIPLTGFPVAVTHTITPFIWNGTSNLVIQTSYSNANAGTSTDDVLMTYSDPGFVSTNYYYSDSQTPATILGYTTPSSAVNSRPNMVLGSSLATAMIWSPVTELYTNSGATTAYTGTAATTVYTKPTANRIYTATATSAAACTNSNTSTITVSSVTAGTVTGGTTICAGNTSALLTLEGNTGSIVRWESAVSPFTSWTPIANTNTTYTSIALTATTQFRAVVQGGGSCGDINSIATTVTVSPASIGGTVNGGATVCSGSNSTLLTLGTHTGAIVRWDSSLDGTNWTPILSTAATYTALNLTASTQFRAVVKSGVCDEAISTAASVNVDPITIPGSISGGATVCSGSNSTLLTLASYTGNILRWESSVNGTTWTPITNTTATYTALDLTTTTQYRAVVQNGVCTSANSVAASVTVNPVTDAGTVVGGATVCAGTNSTLLTLGTHTGAIIRWESSLDGTSWTPIANTTTTYTATNLTVTTQFRAVVQSGVCAEANSIATTVTVDPVSNAGLVSGDASVCSGINSTLLTLGSYTGNILSWESSLNGTTWTPIANTLATYTALNLSATTQYRAVVQSGVCSSANSLAASVTVDPVTESGTVSGGATVCITSNSTLLTLGSHTGSIVRWESSLDGTTWNSIANTVTTYTATNLIVTTQFRAVVQSGSCSSANSNASTVSVDPATDAGAVTGGATVCTGSNSTLLTLGTHSGAILRWESTLDGSTWTPIANTTASYTALNLTATTQYRAVVQSGVCNSANSVATTVTVNPANIGGTLSSNTSLCSTTNSTLLTLTGNTGAITRWESSSDGSTWTPISNTVATYSATNIAVTTQFRVVVQTGVCNAANSSIATITINTPPAVSITSFTNPTVCAASNGTATVNSASSYSWATSPVQTTQTATGLAAGTYFVTVSNGVCSNTTSVTLGDPSAPAVTIVSNDTTICAGTSTTFTAGGAITYEFFINGVSQGTPSTTTTFTTTTLANNNIVTVRGVTLGCTGNSSAISMLVSPVSSGGVLGGATAVCSNANNTTLTLNSYTGVIVRWESSLNGTTWTPIANTVNTFTITNLTATTHYRVVVQNGYCGEANSSEAIITVTPLPTATIAYTGTPFCKSIATAQAVTQTGNNSGTYTALPAGLTINASNGAITPSSSTAGNYTVTYAIAAAGGCSLVTTTTTVTITTAAIASIVYTGSPFCKTLATAQSVSQTGTIGGVYSAASGLTINATTGAITPGSCTAGTYTVTYTIAAAGGCAAVTATASVIITAAPVATIVYTSSPYCTSIATAQSVSQTGTTGGLFSAPSGLNINATTGAITPSTSTAGTYTVTYTIAAAGGCAAVTATTSVVITAAPVATIAYTGTPYCTTIATAQAVNQTGATGGAYSAAGGLTINATTGTITPSTSTAGTYTVTYTIAAAGGCAAVIATASVVITAAPVASIVYTGTPYCTSVATAQSVAQTGTTGGAYTAPSGLSINAVSGAITPSTCTAGSYTVTYTLAAAGGCAAVTATTSVIITAAPIATIVYTGSPYCKTIATAQAVSHTGTSGGVYSAGSGLTINATTGAITPSSSTAGTYTVTYTIAANGGCAAVNATTAVTITTAPVATITYSGTPYCKTVATAQLVTQTGSIGGIYTALPAGLLLDAATGAITPSTSTAGTYTITYTIAAAGGCAAVTATTAVVITAAPTAIIVYTGSPYCKTTTTAQAVSLTGSNGGIYTSSPTGLTINATTGAITPSSCTAGSYTVTYTINAAGGCTTVTASTSVTIIAAPLATIAYAGNPFCKTVTTAQAVTFTGTTGGVFTALPAGLTIDAVTGALIPSTSTAGVYTVSYTIAAAGGCATVTATAPITITNAPTASIAYTGSPYCKSLTTAQAVSLTGSTGGIYTALPTGLSINATTGAITPSASTAGTYTVTYTIAATGGCLAVTSTTSVVITTAPTATIAYAGNPFCKTVSTAQAVTFTGTTGGTFSSTTGLSIDVTTGAITPSTSTAGTYTVTYTIASGGGCAVVTKTTLVTITAAPIASISYTGSPWCPSATVQSVTLTGSIGGSYSSATGLTIVAATGAITPATTTPGAYTVTYTIAAAGGCTAVTANTTLAILPLPANAAAIVSIKNDSVSISELNALYTVPVIMYATSYTWSYSGNGASFIPSATTTSDSVRINFSSTATSGNLTVKGHNSCGDGLVSANYPIWVSPVGIGEFANSFNYKIYPNPTKGMISISINGINSSLDLQIVNIQGQLMHNKKLTIDNQTFIQHIDISTYPKGIYFVKLINKNFTKVEKVVLQ